MWETTEDLTILENIIVQRKFKDGVLKYYQIYPCEGFFLRVPIMDEYKIDDEGNFVLDRNGEKILINPYRSNGGATEMPNYNWQDNPSGYYAEKTETN